MPQIVMTKLKDQDHDKNVKAKIMNFLTKLAGDDTTSGLHIEPMANPADSRARTGRVDLALRAVLYRLDTSDSERVYVYAGTWPHDVAIERARTRKLQVNPINGIAEFVEATAPARQPSHYQPPSVRPPIVAAEPVVETGSYLERLGYTLVQLTDELGLPEALTTGLFRASTEDEIFAVAEGLENQWQSMAVLGLAVGDPIEKIRAELDLTADEPEQSADQTDVVLTEDELIVTSLRHPASQMQFTMIDDDDELRRVIDGGDFGAWRVFLHPEQRKYASRNYNGPFRLSGGAGTGKTVVLLHRACRLANSDVDSRVVLTTFTKALAGNLQRDLERLDPKVHVANELGAGGVLVKGIDSLASAVRSAAGEGFNEAALAVLGAVVESPTRVRGTNDGWRDAIDDSDAVLPETILNPSFFEAEYLQVILPNRLSDKDDYLAIKRPGRGVPLNRKKRAAVWSVVDTYRRSARLMGEISYAEIAEVGAVWLEGRDPASVSLADHILIDEGQDFSPSHWKLARALVRPGRNDMLLAEDTHQRIYGQHVVLSRYGIKITGRSRRLTLNYRTTEQNLDFALRILEGGEYIDAEEQAETAAGYRSSRIGPVPTSLPAKDDAEQFANITALVKGWLSDESTPVLPETIAILARSNSQAKKLQDVLGQHDLPVTLLTSAHSKSKNPVVLTMHTAKGMEFSRVILFDVSEGSIPNKWALHNVAPEEMKDALLRERSLLYVAASRARDTLVVSWKGNPSTLLP